MTATVPSSGKSDSSKDRLLAAAKRLFAAQGFENTSTMSIARASGTSESQLVKHFGSKEGLLEAIFEEGWTQILATAGGLNSATSPDQRLQSLAEALLNGLERDPLLKDLLLLEGRHIRKEGHMILMTRGFRSLVQIIDDLLTQMKDSGRLKSGLDPQAVRSALIGMMEGLLRDQVLSERSGFPAAYSREQLIATFQCVLGSFVRSGR
jgi:AcrR family transcriptional regulator